MGTYNGRQYAGAGLAEPVHEKRRGHGQFRAQLFQQNRSLEWQSKFPIKTMDWMA